MNPENLVRMLRDSVEQLASPADSQVDYLRTLFKGGPFAIDELALELDDVYAAAKPFLSEIAVAALERLDRQLNEMSGTTNSELWTEEGLRLAPQWATVRELAAEANAALGPR